MNKLPNIDWFRSKLVASAAGLLGEEDQARFNAMRAADPECARVYDSFHETDGDPAGEIGHLPAEVVARWDSAKGALRGLERQLVRAHLSRCSSCREDLELLGFVPELEVIPALEGTQATLLQEDTASGADIHDKARTVINVIKDRGEKARSWWRWATGGWAVVATAAAAALLLLRGPGVPLQVVVLNPIVRGESQRAVHPISPDTRAVDIDVSRLDISGAEDPREALVRVTMRGPDASELFSYTTTVNALTYTRIIIRRPDGAPLETGVYELELLSDDGVTQVYPVELTR